jgi:hypothetical protein
MLLLLLLLLQLMLLLPYFVIVCLFLADKGSCCLTCSLLFCAGHPDGDRQCYHYLTKWAFGSHEQTITRPPPMMLLLLLLLPAA